MIDRSSLAAVAAIGAVLAIFPSFATAEPTPEVTHDGLHRVKGSTVQQAYLKPDVDLSQYKRMLILDCFVAFKKNWRSNNSRVTRHDMERIKKSLAEEFAVIFSEELQKGGYPIVAEADEDVLLIRPAIIDLDVVAPDPRDANRSFTFAASAGEMTLYLELYDSVSGEILARVVDRTGSPRAMCLRWTTRATNVEMARESLRHWAGLLRARLDEVHGRSDD